MTQPVAQVTNADVERLVRRDFPPQQVAAALALVNQYAGQNSARVRAAMLKLAGSSIEALRIRLETATIDYRDVLAPAEYPEYLRYSYAEIQELSEAEVQSIYDRDWQQYQDWFAADGGH